MPDSFEWNTQRILSWKCIKFRLTLIMIHLSSLPTITAVATLITATECISTSEETTRPWHCFLSNEVSFALLWHRDSLFYGVILQITLSETTMRKSLRSVPSKDISTLFFLCKPTRPFARHISQFNIRVVCLCITHIPLSVILISIVYFTSSTKFMKWY